MGYKITFAVFAVFFLVGTVFASSFALAQSSGGFSSRSASSVTFQEAPTFQSLYGSQATTYWPVLGDRDTCEAREDLMLQVAPFGCQPAVVRSDLLAEQDVPVFCQIDALEINPLIDIEQVRNIQFTGDYPPEIAGAGFHPARAALGSQQSLIGSPLTDNIGYVVLVLKRQPDESKLPDSVNVTLRASIDYDTGNAYGIGRSEFILEPTAFEDWGTEKYKQSFWNGRYFIRLEDADENLARVTIYNGDAKAITTTVRKGETSEEFYVPGMYCRAGLRVAYDEYVAAENKARIEVSSDGSVDAFDVYEGSRFLDGRCSVKKIEIREDGETGKVIGYCGSEQFVLELGKEGSGEGGVSSIFMDGKQYPISKLGNKYWVDLSNYSDSNLQGLYSFDVSNGELWKDGGASYILNGSTEGDFGISDLQNKDWYLNLYALMSEFVGEDAPVEGEGVDYVQRYYEQAIATYEKVAESYSSEGEYAKDALIKAKDLAKKIGDSETAARMLNLYIALYPEDGLVPTLKDELNGLRSLDLSLTSEVVEVDGRLRVIRLAALDAPGRKASADFTALQGGSLQLTLGGGFEDLKNGPGEDDIVARVKLEEVDVDKAELAAYCRTTDANGNKIFSTTKTPRLFNIDDEDPKDVCGVNVRLDSTNVERVAKIRLLPSGGGARSQTNVTVAVGIEKRAIELTPDKVAQRIENLNKTIEKWQNIADALGKVVSGMKGACFATAALLTFKNFMTGLSGEALARQEVMRGDNGWTAWCEARVPKDYPTMDACFLANAGKIDADVAKTNAALNKVNQRIKQLQQGHTQNDGLFGQSVNTEKLREDLAKDISQAYGTEKINMSGSPWKMADGTTKEEITVAELLTPENVENGLISTEGMRSLMLNAELQKQGGLSERHNQGVGSSLKDIASRVNSNMDVNWQFQANKAATAQGLPAAFEAESLTSQQRHADVKSLNDQLRTTTGLSAEAKHVATVIVPPGSSGQGEGLERFGGGTYYLGLEGNPQTGVYSIMEVRNSTKDKVDAPAFASTYKLGTIKSLDGLSYQNAIQTSDHFVRYYETEPYKGMPAIVPFDTREGWYAATQQTLPAFGGIGAFDASGRVTSFWICNVGENGRIQFDSGFGDDLCQQINLNTGQPLNAFPGLDSSKASSLIQRGQRAIQDAARQYGNKFVSVDGERFEVGAPSVGVPGTNCQDFMSPKDCNLLFNVCDPVVCPPSRCNLGGTYHVSNVIQTGIIGSIFMCLPNVREGIFIPVCLTGIHAGIEGFVSILKNHRDCLQESLETGQMVGICDQIYSIYLCEFFWNQVAPFVNVIIPKLIEFAYGQGVRGGAEYLSVMSAWQNMENSVNYFTQQYAVNSFEAFQARSVQEIGSQVCKSFISVKAPTAFDSLLGPDSPPQFHAWFDQKTFSSATVPATSQYKVFYHIFAGNTQGTHYNVYLRDPPTSGYYANNPTVSVASGYINAGEYASETRDFTAPEGYKELCVRINNQEECGFGQVSTDFAVNYLRDQYIKSEASRVTITSQRECVSGSNNPATLLNPNIQAGVEETISPEIYNRGIVRICSSDNPGSQTDPSRYTDVGYCDDPKIRCWIDQRSVEGAITQGNVGTLNETLEVLDERMRAMLEAQGEILGDSEATQKLMLLKDRVGNLQTPQNALNLLNETEQLFGKLFWNRHKAELLIVQGDAYTYLALNAKMLEDQQKADQDDGDDPNVESELSGYSLQLDSESGMRRVLYKGDFTNILYFSEEDDTKDYLGLFRDATRPRDMGGGRVSYPVIGSVRRELNGVKGYIDYDGGGVTDDKVKENMGRLYGESFYEVFNVPQLGGDDEDLDSERTGGEEAGEGGDDEVPYRLGAKTPFNNMDVEYVYVGETKSQVYLSGGVVYVYSDTGQQEIGSYSPDNSAIEIDSLDNVKTEGGFFSIFDVVNFIVFPRDYEILMTLKNKKYSYCDLGGEDCNKEGALRAVSENLCDSACSGFFGCDREDCESAGSCFFEDVRWGKNKCHSCEGSTCSSYPNEATCRENRCDLQNCEWDSSGQRCLTRIKEVPENMGDGDDSGGGDEGGDTPGLPSGIEEGSFLHRNGFLPEVDETGNFSFMLAYETYIVLTNDNKLERHYGDQITYFEPEGLVLETATLDDEVGGEYRTTYRDIKKEMCYFKNVNGPGGCLWDPETDNVKVPKLPPEDRLLLQETIAEGRDYYVLFTTLTERNNWTGSKVFINQGSSSLRLADDISEPFNIRDSVEIAKIEGQFNLNRDWIDIISFNESHINDKFAEISLCNFDGFVRDFNRYKVDLGYAGPGTEGCIAH